MATREEQRREHNEQKELESLRRVFESLDKTRCGKIGFKEVNDQLVKLEYRAKRVEVRARRDGTRLFIFPARVWFGSAPPVVTPVRTSLWAA